MTSLSLSMARLKVATLTAIASFGVMQNAIAASTMVTDAVGTQELWTFQEVLGAQKLLSKVNQTDGKGITQTWDANGNKLTRTDEEGRVTQYIYNATNQRTAMTEAAGTPQARTTHYEYVNADVDLLTKTSSPSVFAGSSKETVNTYDANLNITAVTINGFDTQGNAVSRSTAFTYDSFGKVTSIDGPRSDVNDTTTMQYYNCNTGAECGQLSQISNALGHTTSYDSYDTAARLLQSTDANGTITTYTYHPRGWLLSMTQTPTVGDARLSSYEYDNAGQLTKTTLPDGTEQNYVYDAAHDLREITDNLGNTVTYLYDAKGNRTHEEVFDPDGTLLRQSITTYNHRNFIESINNGGSITQLINDAVGNLGSQTDPNANPSTDHSFDALDRLSTTVDALSNNSNYAYNVADQVTQVTAPNGAQTNYEYDDLGNQTKEISADRGTIVYSHDVAGNVTSMTDARGITTQYQYDALNRLINVTYPTISENIRYVYDNGVSDQDCGLSVGRLCQVQDDSGVDSYQYDAWGNVLRCEKIERNETDVDIGRYTSLYEYDAVNRITGMQYPSGRIISITRDVIGRLMGLDTQDTEGQISNIITSRRFRADGLVSHQSYGNGLNQAKQYDLQGRLSKHTAGTRGGDIYNRDYQYDPNGNILSIDSPNIASQAAIRDRDYDYDVLDRLTRESDLINNMIRDFGYDANGNRQQFSENNNVSNLSYAPSTNRLSDIDATPITLDASGRTVSDNQGRRFTYNNAGRVQSITQGGQTLGRYTYNNQQLRTQKVLNGATTVYHYDLAGNLIAESDQTGTVLQEYIYADGQRVATFALENNHSGTDPDTVASIELDAHQTYGGTAQDKANTGDVTLQANNTSITLNGNRWRAVPFNYQITPLTVLEFDFSSTQQGEIHGIALDTDLAISRDRTFALHGTQNWGINAFKNYAGGTQHYTIAIGQFYTGDTNYIGFSMDDDAAGISNSQFSNIKVYEGSEVITQGILDLTAVQSYGGNQDKANTGPVENPDGQTVRLKGNRWQKLYAPITITPTMELHFDFKSNTQGEIHGIGVDTDNQISATQTFNIWGTQNWGNRSQAAYTGNGAYQSYQIPIGEVLTGDYTYLTFVMDDDANKQGESVFSNVQFVDPENPPAAEQEIGIQYYINDHLMTPQLAVNQDNDITWQADYSAFGKADITVEGFINNHRFAGQYFDQETGLHYNWNRYYDPGTGRYITSDPIGLSGGLNTFGYVGGNPVNFIDPNGLQAGTLGRLLGGSGGAVGSTGQGGAQSGSNGGYSAAGAAVYGSLNEASDLANDRPWRKPSRWKVITRCNVNSQKGCDGNCPNTIGGWAYGSTFREAEKRAQSDANANLGFQGFSGCQARHCDPVQCFENGRQVACPRGRPRVR